MTTSLDCKWPTLTGHQEAYNLVLDDGDQSEAEKALTFYERINREQIPWQEDVTRGILTLEPDGLFTHPTAVVIACRQNGKSLSAAELRILYGLFLRGEKIVYSAQRWSTAESIFKRLKRLIESRPSLKRRMVRQTCSQGQASIELESGASAGFITRSLDAGRGFDQIDVIIYDEAYNLKDAETAALSPTQLASKNPQTIYLSSAVNQEVHANGQVLAGIRYRALEAIKTSATRTGLYYAEYMAPPPPEGCSESDRRRIREDPETWRLANPSYGVIQTEAKVRKLLTELGPKSFEVEILGWGDWPEVAGSHRLIDPDFWNDLTDPNPKVVSPYPRVIGVDLAPVSRTWSISGTQYTENGATYGEVSFSDKASPTDVVEKLIGIITDSDPAALLIQQQSPAAVLKPLLDAAGIEPVIVNQSEFAVACEGFLEAVLSGQFAHNGWQSLADSVAATVKKDLPGGRFIWSSDGGGSIVHLMSMTLAHFGLLTYARPQKHSPPPLADSEPYNEPYDSPVSDEIDVMSVPF
jgi:Phage Terminase